MGPSLQNEQPPLHCPASANVATGAWLGHTVPGAKKGWEALPHSVAALPVSVHISELELIIGQVVVFILFLISDSIGELDLPEWSHGCGICHLGPLCSSGRGTEEQSGVRMLTGGMGVPWLHSHPTVLASPSLGGCFHFLGCCLWTTPCVQGRLGLILCHTNGTSAVLSSC